MTSRSAYRHSLDELWESMAAMARLDAIAIERASSALSQGNQHLAESVITDQAEISRRALELEDRAAELIARQQPVATDLRLVMSTVTMAPALERMGGLARHVAQTTRMRAPELAVVEAMHDIFLAMGANAVATANDLATVIAERDAQGAIKIQRADGEMDRLHRDLFARTLAPSWSYGVEPAVDAALLGRFYERFADQAVSVAQRVHYIVTGRYPAQG